MSSELDSSPAAVAGDFWCLAAAVEAWETEATPAARLAAVREALAPVEVDPASQEVRSLAMLPVKARSLLAESLGAAGRELLLEIEEGADPEGTLERVRARIQGCLRVVERMSPAGLPGFLGELQSRHGGA